MEAYMNREQIVKWRKGCWDTEERSAGDVEDLKKVFPLSHQLND